MTFQEVYERLTSGQYFEHLGLALWDEKCPEEFETNAMDFQDGEMFARFEGKTGFQLDVRIYPNHSMVPILLDGSEERIYVTVISAVIQFGGDEDQRYQVSCIIHKIKEELETELPIEIRGNVIKNMEFYDLLEKEVGKKRLESIALALSFNPKSPSFYDSVWLYGKEGEEMIRILEAKGVGIKVQKIQVYETLFPCYKVTFEEGKLSYESYSLLTQGI